MVFTEPGMSALSIWELRKVSSGRAVIPLLSSTEVILPESNTPSPKVAPPGMLMDWTPEN